MSVLTNRPNNIWLTCPKCQTQFTVAINPCRSESEPQIVTCPTDRSGCGKPFAVKITLVPAIITYRLEAVEVEA